MVITRLNKDAKTVEKTWSFAITTDSQMDAWLIHYGFTYQPAVFSKYPQYFTKADPTQANTYTVTQMSGSPQTAWQNTSPTLAFTHPFYREYSPLMPGMSIITGTNFTTYSEVAGLSAIIAYNGLISCGILYAQKCQLNGMYQPGETIKDNLSFDQIHTKRGGFELYFTIALRFDKNPFNSSSSSGLGSSGGSGSTGSSKSSGSATPSTSTKPAN